MKRKIVASLLVMTIAMTAFGCSDPSDMAGSSDSNESQSEETTLPESEEVSAGDAADAASGETPVEAESEVSDAEMVQLEVTSGSAETVEVAPEEITEPELPTAEVQQPAEETVVAQEAPAEEAVAAQPEAVVEEEDTTYDIVFMGDSQFDNARGTGSEIPAYTCCLLDKSVKYYNLAIGGTAASLERGEGVEFDSFSDSCFIGMCYALSGKIDSQFLDQYPAGEELKRVKPKNVDLYIIEYGANDYINGKDLYNPDYSFDPHTYSGALATGIGELQSVSPDAEFLVCSPSYCVWYNGAGSMIGDAYTVSKGIGPLSQYANMASNLANESGYEYFESMYASQFDLKIETVEDYLSDGLHYNEKGRQVYSAALAHKIQQIRGYEDSELPYIEINMFDFWEYKKSLKK